MLRKQTFLILLLAIAILITGVAVSKRRHDAEFIDGRYFVLAARMFTDGKSRYALDSFRRQLEETARKNPEVRVHDDDEVMTGVFNAVNHRGAETSFGCSNDQSHPVFVSIAYRFIDSILAVVVNEVTYRDRPDSFRTCLSRPIRGLTFSNSRKVGMLTSTLVSAMLCP